jgi:hypothetical protein
MNNKNNNEPKFYTEIEYYKYIIEQQQKRINDLEKLLNNK